MEASASRKASRVSRTSPELSSTNSTSVATWCPPPVFANRLQSPERQQGRPYPAGAVNWNNLREKFAAILYLCNVALLRQSDGGQPEFVEALQQFLECIQRYRLGQVAIRLQLVALGHIRLCLRSGQDHDRNGLQFVILLDLRQHLRPIHSRHIQVQQDHVRAG